VLTDADGESMPTSKVIVQVANYKFLGSESWGRSNGHGFGGWGVKNGAAPRRRRHDRKTLTCDEVPRSTARRSAA
jgi:hypothetical protein